MRFQPLSEHQLLVFWVQLLVLVLVARGLGSLVRRVGQPAVVGELAAGVLLGPSVLGALAPGVWGWLFPDDAVHAGLMNGIGWLGVFFLLVLAGVETDLGLVRRLGRAAAWVSAGSLVVPLGFGLAVGVAMPGLFLGEAGDRTVFALFMATALAISSLPVVAKVLSELDLVRRDFAQLTLAAGMANDVVGWVLLGVIAGLAQSGEVDLQQIATAVAGLAVLVGLTFTLGQRATDGLLRAVRRTDGGPTGALTIMVLAALVGAVGAQAIGLEGVLGAFLAGIVLGRSKFGDRQAVSVLEAVTAGVLAPVFFARAGLRVELAALGDPETLAWAGVVLLAASVSKFAGAYAGAWIAGRAPREGLALGAGLNARGALEIVVASVGLTLGVLNDASYTVVVMMAIATSMMAPVMLRAVAHGWQGTADERERLLREQVLARNRLVRAARLLLPSHGGANSTLAARLLDLAWPEGAEATILSVGGDVVPEQIERVRAAFTARPAEHEHLEAADPLQAILEHARLGYGAIGVGATDRTSAQGLVSPLVDALLATSPLPVIIVRRGPGGEPDGVRRILVPAVGTPAGDAALEVAFGMAQRSGATASMVHVVTVERPSLGRTLMPWLVGADDGVDDSRRGVATHILDDARQVADEMGVRTEAHVRAGSSVSELLLELGRELAPDVMVVAANVRQLSGRPFLGHGVERLLERSACTLVVVATPPDWNRA